MVMEVEENRKEKQENSDVECRGWELGGTRCGGEC
jgi:hypothetical protein